LQVDEFADDGGGKKGKGKKDAKKEGMMADKEEAALRKAEAKKLAEDEEESLSTVREPHPNPSPHFTRAKEGGVSLTRRSWASQPTPPSP
jgi:hypothetical protein